MQNSFWPSKTVPIILLPAGDQGQEIRALARSWVQLGLLGPALWVSPEDVTIGANAPPVVTASVLKLGEDREVLDLRRDLFEVLARDELSRVRIIKVRSSTPKRELDLVQDSIAAALSRYVKHSVPTADPNQNISQQDLVLSEVTLICAPTEFQVSERVGWATDDPGLIVIASPEDRSSPWSGDAFVRDNDRFVGFCLMHVVTVAGLWNAAPIGSFELFSHEASMHHSIWISRVFVNAVMMDGFSRRVAAQVLADAADGNADVVDVATAVPPLGTAFIPEDRRAHYARLFVDGVFRLDQGQLDYSPAAEFVARSKQHLSLPAQLAAFTSFSLDKIVAVPQWAYRWALERSSRKATSALHGDDGLAVVGENRSEFDIRDRALVEQRVRVAAEAASARTTAAEFEGVTAVRSTPTLWSRLREVVFGSLDGSADLSELGFGPIEDRIPVFSRVGDLIQPVDDRWIFPDSPRPDDIPASVGLDQLDDASSFKEAIQRWAHEAENLIADRESERRSVLAELSTLETRQKDLAIVLFEHELVEYDVHGNPTIIKGKRAPSPKKVDLEAGDEDLINLVEAKREFLEFASAHKLVQRRLEAVESSIVASHELLADRRGVVKDFDRWTAAHKGSVYGQIMEGMAARRDKAEQDLATAESALEAVALPEAGQLITLRKAFHRRIGLAAVVVLATMALLFLATSVWPDLRSSPWWPDGWQMVALAAAAMIVVLIVALMRYHRGWSRIERQLLDVSDQLEWGAHAVRHCRAELRRMAVIHRQALDWLQLLAVVLHKPWEVKPSWLSADPPAVDRGSLPYAMRLAVTREDDPVAGGRIKREAAQSLMVKGWRAGAFATLLDELCARLGYDASTLGLDALDSDLPHASNHSRRILLEHAQDSGVLRSVAQRYLRRIVGEVQGVSLSRSNPRVTPIVADPLSGEGAHQPPESTLPGSLLEWDTFLLDSLAGRADPVTPIGSLGIAEMSLADAHHEKVRSYLLVPNRLLDDVPSRGSSGRLSVRGYDDVQVRALDLVLRVDVAGPIPANAARLWERASAPDRPTRAKTKSREGL